MDDSLHQLLGRSIRRQILGWWKTRGIWFVAALVVAYGSSILILHSSRIGLPIPVGVGISLMHGPLGCILTGIAWLSLIGFVNAEISRLIDRQALPHSDEITIARYLIGLRQGLPLLGLVAVLAGATEAAIWLSGNNLGLPGFNAWVIVTSIGGSVIYTYTPLLLSMVWLAGIAALAPRRVYLAWILLVAGFIAEIPQDWRWGSHGTPYWFTGDYLTGPWFILSALFGTLAFAWFLAAVRLKRLKPATYLLSIIVGAMLLSGIAAGIKMFSRSGPYFDLLWDTSNYCSMVWAFPFKVIPALPGSVAGLTGITTISAETGDYTVLLGLMMRFLWMMLWVYGIHLLLRHVILRRAYSKSDRRDG